MLTEKQINEIKEHLNRAQNPLFLFDNDQDGLCSFLLLQRWLGRGKGFPVKTMPLNENYFRKINELDADYVFILDVPRVGDSFFEKIEQTNVPLVWIDHHQPDEAIPDFINYYNPLFNKEKTNEPVTEICYQITQKKEDLWLAVVGCISDNYVPDFYSDFKKKYPELSVDSKDAVELFYGSEIGRLARIFGLAIKDKTTNVIQMMKFLRKAKGPYDVLQESKENRQIHKRFNEINKKYEKLLKKAKKTGEKSGKVLFFDYGGDMSISSEIANGLKYFFPEKIIVVNYIKGVKTNISMRGEKVRELVLKAIEGLGGATAGGHERAVGARINFDDLEEFKKRVEKIVEDRKV